MKISIIVAMDNNRVIGINNTLPWRLPADLKNVKKITMGHSIVMGRKNYESIGRPLPGRRNIILTRNNNYSVAGCEIVHSIEEVINLCEGEEEIFIFGGEQIYNLFLPLTDKIYLTKINNEFDGDTFFPEINFNEWKEVSFENGEKDEKNPYHYTFHVFEKKIIVK